MSNDYTLDFSTLPTDDEGVPIIEVGDTTYRLPYHDLIEQTVDMEALVESIESEGIQQHLLADEETHDVIDGMTRLYAATQILDLPADEIPIEHRDYGDDAWQRAIELNANRRQISGAMRRDLIQTIMERSSWRKARAHVSDLARMLGVAKSTISKDLDKIEDDDEVQELKDRKRKISTAMTGLRHAYNLIQDGQILTDISEELRADYAGTTDEFLRELKEVRESISEEIEEIEADKE